MIELQRETVLVTGATGFTGGCLARELVKRGWAVRALARPTSDTRSLRAAGVDIVHGDLTDERAVRNSAKGVSVIYHIAAVYRTAKHADSYYWDVNVRGTKNVLAAAKIHDVGRVVHCSTAGVHGEVDTVPADETAPMKPGDIYQETKLHGEIAAQQAFAAGLPGVVFRPVGMYGPGDTRFLKLFRAIATGRFRMFGSGQVLYHLTYIDDLVDGIIRCGTQESALGQTYILAGERFTTLNEMVSAVANAVGRSAPGGRLPLWPLLMAGAMCEAACKPFGVEPPLHRRRVDFFRKDRAFSIEKARDELGYNPTVDLEDGMTRTAAWYFANDWLSKPKHQSNDVSTRRRSAMQEQA